METKASNELLFIISPPPAIAEYVAMLKQHVRLAIGHSFDDESGQAHISLFQYRDARAEDWLYQIDSTISSFAPFHVHIKNLNYRDHGTTRTIYLDVVHKNPICEIVEKFSRPEGEFTPCITIARNLDINDFFKAWKSLKNLSYSDYFRCDHITVLKRSPKRWMYYMDLPLAA